MKTPCNAVPHDDRSQMLSMKDGGKVQPGIASSFEFTPAASSTHLRVLKEAGLVGELRACQGGAYSVNKEKISVVMDFSDLSRDDEPIRSKGHAEEGKNEEKAGRR
jgi:DNA-binding transcriptional ArsR family regulator